MIEVDVGGVGDAGYAAAVDSGAFDLRKDVLFEAVAQSGDPIRIACFEYFLCGEDDAPAIF